MSKECFYPSRGPAGVTFKLSGQLVHSVVLSNDYFEKLMKIQAGYERGGQLMAAIGKGIASGLGSGLYHDIVFSFQLPAFMQLPTPLDVWLSHQELIVLDVSRWTLTTRLLEAECSKCGKSGACTKGGDWTERARSCKVNLSSHHLLSLAHSHHLTTRA